MYLYIVVYICTYLLISDKLLGQCVPLSRTFRQKHVPIGFYQLGRLLTRMDGSNELIRKIRMGLGRAGWGNGNWQ